MKLLVLLRACAVAPSKARYIIDTAITIRVNMKVRRVFPKTEPNAELLRADIERLINIGRLKSAMKKVRTLNNVLKGILMLPAMSEEATRAIIE